MSNHEDQDTVRLPLKTDRTFIAALAVGFGGLIVALAYVLSI